MGGLLSQGSDSFQAVPCGSQACPPGLMAPVLGLGPTPPPEWPPHITPQRVDQPAWVKPGPVAGAPDSGSSGQTDCLEALPGEPEPVLVLFHPLGLPWPWRGMGGGGMFLPSCVEPSRPGLGFQDSGSYSQWTSSRSQNTPNRWAEFPGRQRTDNLANRAS